MVEDELADARRFGIPDAEGTALRTLDATARLGASGLADRAHDELVAAGARPRRDRRLLSGRESLTAALGLGP